MVIAIDGPGGVGKSTASRAIARCLGLGYLNSGALYRAATLAVLRAGVDPGDAAAVLDVVIRAGVDWTGEAVLLDGEDVSAPIREAAVTAAVSAVSAVAGVRDVVNEVQRVWVASQGGRAVVEGRDIGSVVFPEADTKVFLDARPEVRAARRAADREAGGKDLAAVEADLARRDRHDSARDVSPLRAAPDAVVIDTSDLTVDEVVRSVLALVAATEDGIL